MADLNKCKDENCAPVVQVRGKMGAGDYPSYPDDYYERVEMEDAIRGDVRVCCKVCGSASGWTKPDAPGMPGAGTDYMVKRWNEDHPAS
jgi:hypothetical protein